MVRIGIDFDNTIINYDDIFYELSVREKLIPPSCSKNKRCIRDHIRTLPNGEIQWQRIQAQVYGAYIEKAKLADGVTQFFSLCYNHGVQIHIISHKTKYSNLEKSGLDLRQAAMNWMIKNNFFKSNGLGLSRHDVYFENSRQEKIKRICELGCTHFIDDLEETFCESDFPVKVEKILYLSKRENQSSTLRGINIFHHWEEMSHYFFQSISSC